MATAEQLKNLIRSHFDGETDSFFTAALQLAAHEAQQGHAGVAHEIRDMVDRAKSRSNRILPFSRELDNMVLSSSPTIRLSDLVVSHEILARIKRILREFHQQEKLRKHGLSHRRKLLLAGPPGTGKTMTAAVLSHELSLPFYTILMDKLVTKFMGETSAKLRQIFEIIRNRRGIYLFDEFDAIGGERGREDDVGEMRRVLNAFLQFLDHDSSEGLIVAATNSPGILDQALFRRFDDVLHYQLPQLEEIRQLLGNRLGEFRAPGLKLDTAAKEAISLSHAEIAQACDDATKEAILADGTVVTAMLLKRMIRERKAAYHS